MKQLSLLCLLPLFFCHLANADTEYTGLVNCWTQPTKVYVFTFSGSFSSGKAGTSQDFQFGDTAPFDTVCTQLPDNSYYAYEEYAKAEMDSRYPITGNVMHLGSNLDIVVTLDPSAGSSKYWQKTPFMDIPISYRVENRYYSMTAAHRGDVLVTLTTDAIGGAVVIPPGIVLWKYYVSSQAGGYAASPLTEGTTAGQIIPVAVTCTINNGQTINVDFGDLESSSLKSDGPSSTVKKDVTLNYSCTSSLTQDIEIALVGNTASFESTALSSSIADIGVVMMQNGTPIKPYGYFNSKLVNGTGSDTVTFSPIIRSGATNVQGNFTASATLVMTSA